MRLELLIATLALLASAAASIATVVQTGVVGRQLSASVWPYLTIEDVYARDGFALSVVNEGLGPAIVRDVSLSVDGRAMPDWNAALRAGIARDRHDRRIPVVTTERDFGTGSVLRPGDATRLITLRSHARADLRYADVPRPKLEICYCSILQQCWIADGNAIDQPRSVSRCSGGTSTLTQ